MRKIILVKGMENIIDAHPLITNIQTKRYPTVSPIRNLMPILKENAAPTPANASTAGPGVITIEKTAKANPNISCFFH